MIVHKLPHCILLLTTKRLLIIDNATEETWRSIPTDSIDRVDDIIINNTNNNENDTNNNSERGTMVHTRDGAQVTFIISNSFRKVGFVEALQGSML